MPTDEMHIDRSKDFGPFDGRIWLNSSHQGPLPRVAVAAAHQALDLKIKPVNVSTSAPFNEVPARLRTALGQLLNVSADDVILGNSAAHGMHAMALGFPWQEGDEVVLVEGDFPSTTFPFLLLKDRGVTIRWIKPKGRMVTADDLREHLSGRTRMFCTTWVHSFRGHAVDLNELGSVCRSAGVAFVVNASQGVGARPLDVTNTPVDAVAGVGFKWLLGPYGTGYAWISPELRDQMNPTRLYWLAHFSADQLTGDTIPDPRDDLGARAYDIFGTANFNNYMPWTASIEYLLEIGIDNVARHNQMLVEQLIQSVDDAYTVLSPRECPERSTIVLLTHVDQTRNPAIFEKTRAAGIDHSLRLGNLRFAPHIYNTPADIDAVVAVLNREA